MLGGEERVSRSTFIERERKEGRDNREKRLAKMFQLVEGLLHAVVAGDVLGLFSSPLSSLRESICIDSLIVERTEGIEERVSIPLIFDCSHVVGHQSSPFPHFVHSSRGWGMERWARRTSEEERETPLLVDKLLLDEENHMEKRDARLHFPLQAVDTFEGVIELSPIPGRSSSSLSRK